MWVIVAMSLAFSDAPKLTVVPGPEFKTEAECIRAVKVRGGFDSQGGGLEFSVCVPKDSLSLGQQFGFNSDKHDAH